MGVTICRALPEASRRYVPRFPWIGFLTRAIDATSHRARPVLHISIVHSLQSGQKAERISIAADPFAALAGTK